MRMRLPGAGGFVLLAALGCIVKPLWSRTERGAPAGPGGCQLTAANPSVKRCAALHGQGSQLLKTDDLSHAELRIMPWACCCR